MIEIENLEFTHINHLGEDTHRISMQNISLTKNEFIFISGPSGSGKSTFLAILAGLAPEHIHGTLSGSFKIDLPKSNVAYVFQNPYSQILTPNVDEELVFTMENYNFPREKILENSIKVSKKLSLEKLKGRKTTFLSGGECQRLVIGSVLAAEPEVLLFDEPTAFLDPEGRQIFYKILSELKGKYTIIIIDHFVNEILPLVDKIIEFDSCGNAKQCLSFNEFSKKNQLKTNLAIHENKAKNISANKLEIKNLNLTLGNKKIFDDLSFCFESNKIYSIIGSNGAGKTTLLKKIAEVNSSDNLGMVFQNPETHFLFDTVFEELKFDCDDENKIEKLTKKFGLYEKLRMSPFLLSEGEKRRLSILLSILQNKQIILFDEPTFGLDDLNIEKVESVVIENQNLGKLQVVITHDLDFAKRISDEILELKNGKLNSFNLDEYSLGKIGESKLC